MTLSPHRQQGILIGLLMIFGVVFVARGPLRAIDGGTDLVHLYAAAVVWLEGGSPYDGQQCADAMAHAGYSNPQHVASGSYYPPPTIAALSPLGLMSWESARLVWLSLNLIACGVLVWALTCWLTVLQGSSRGMLAVLLVIAWGPAMTALSLGQLSIVASALIFSGLILLDRGKPWIAGLLLAAGCLIKPQLGLGFLLLIALRREWLTLGVGLALIAMVTGLGIGRLMLTTPDWAGQMAGNIANDQTMGLVLDASPDAPMRFQMIDLRPLLYLLVSEAWVGFSALLVAASLAAVAIVKLLRLGIQRHVLLATAGVGLLVLLPVYHRAYDAMLLLPLLALVINHVRRAPRDRLMMLIGLAMLPLFLPLPAILAVVRQRGLISDNLYHTWLWQNVVMQHQSWCLLIASIALVVWTWRISPSHDETSSHKDVSDNQPLIQTSDESCSSRPA